MEAKKNMRCRDGSSPCRRASRLLLPKQDGGVEGVFEERHGGET